MLNRVALVSVSASASLFNIQTNTPRYLGQPHILKKFTQFTNPLLHFTKLCGNFSHNNNIHRMDGSSSSFVTCASAQPLQNADELIDSVETFIFDCDGVIWKGDSLIDGVPETLDMLRSKGKRLVFVTNNSTKSRKQYGKKFETLGLSVNEEEIFASSFAAAAYLKSINFPKDKKVYVIGEEGILKELELAGFQYLGGPDDGEKKIELKPGFLMQHDEDVGAVVVGFDRYFNYYKVQFLRVTHPPPLETPLSVRLACVKHATIVNPESGSNSPRDS